MATRSGSSRTCSRHLGDTSGATLAVGAAALALLFGVERFAPRIPGGLVALVAGIVISAALDLASHGVEIVGDVPSGLPSVGLPSVDSADALTLLAAAGGMVLVIYSESLGAAEKFATKYGYEIDPNQELIALGVANVGSGLIGGLAAGGSLSQSAVNEGAGARSEVSPLVAAALMLVTVLLLTPLFKDLPEAVLAALIIHAVSHLFKVAEFKRYYREQRVEFVLGAGDAAGRHHARRAPGLVIGVVVDAAARHLPREQAARRRARTAARHAGSLRRRRAPSRLRAHPGLLVLRLEAPLFYANAALTRDRIKQLIGAREPLPRAVILEVGANESLDITSGRDPSAADRGAQVGGHQLRAGRCAVAGARDGASHRSPRRARRGARLPDGRPGDRRARTGPSFIPSGRCDHCTSSGSSGGPAATSRQSHAEREVTTMGEPFKGTINVDIRDSVPDWAPFEPPKAPDGRRACSTSCWTTSASRR